MKKRYYIIIIICLLITFYLISKTSIPFDIYLKNLKSQKELGLIAYFFITLSSTVIAPLSTLALTPVASNLWGWKEIFFISILSWQIGAIINFHIARKYGRKLLEKFVNIKKLDELNKKLYNIDQFFSIVLLRMIIPVDLLSYALGLTKIKFKIYFWATLIGIIPFAFVFSYIGDIGNAIKILPFISAGILILWLINKK